MKFLPLIRSKSILTPLDPQTVLISFWMDGMVFWFPFFIARMAATCSDADSDLYEESFDLF